YIRAIVANTLPFTAETLTLTDRYNEYVMTGLRTIWGVSLARIEREFGKQYAAYLLQHAQKHLENGLLVLENPASSGGETSPTLKTTRKGKFFCDGIASDLFSTFTVNESNDNIRGADV
ncbi:MAG: hypothetical protein KDD04_11960, partial [Sinomicrobium sp.]|nr:hypothetical protein [Sinomicrobium sp.]